MRTHYGSATTHVCGLYYNVGEGWQQKRIYLPQVELKSYTSINPVCFTTELIQTFHNTSQDTLNQVRYTFPLYDGVAVNGYTITYGDQTFKGIVKQKDDAKRTYQDAVDRGETAGLLESLPAGVFGVTLGNLPPKADVQVRITYCGELKHDAAVDGLRYMLPTSIAPRYGDYPGEVTSNVASKGINITVDVDMARSAIRKMTSPSHPISVSMGGTSTAAANAEFRPSQASASLALGTTELAGDFILQILIDDISKPQAILETHATVPNQRAIMATLVPKFALPPANPELVFIADQSGSMGGSKNTALVAALKVFLKSLPFGVRFNICAFGSDYKFLWPTSQAYSESSVNTAVDFVSGFQAGYGGTEMFEPVKAAFEQKLSGMPLELMLLTDGEIWGEQDLFNFITDQVHEKKVDARVFALGIGNDVSHTLVEGVARAGNGFAQFVTQNEETDQKVIRMLKAALYAHTKGYELEVHYSEDADTDGFEIVGKVKDCLVLDDNTTTENPVPAAEKPAARSFFDTAVDLDKKPTDQTDRYAHLRNDVETPRLLQAPSNIPPLFPFSRTTVYLLLGPESAQNDVKSITLRASSAEGPLELTVPVHSTTTGNGSTIHHLAARKAIQDLEEGRGWLQSAKSAASGDLVKKAHESRFDEIVEREAVKLGVRFQVASKWTSFVAVGDKQEHGTEDAHVGESAAGYVHEHQRDRFRGGGSGVFGSAAPAATPHAFGRANVAPSASSLFAQPQAPARNALFADQSLTSGLFGSPAPTASFRSTGVQAQSFAAPPRMQLASMSYSRESPLLFSIPQQAPPIVKIDKEVMRQYQQEMADAAQMPLDLSNDGDTGLDEDMGSDSAEDMGFGLYNDPPYATGSNFLCADAEEEVGADVEGIQDALQSEVTDMDLDPNNHTFGKCCANASSAHPAPQARSSGGPPPVKQLATKAARRAPPPAPAARMPLSAGVMAQSEEAPKKKRLCGLRSSSRTTSADPPPSDPVTSLHTLVALQTFSGSWPWSSDVFDAIGIDERDAKINGSNDRVVRTTALVVAYLEKNVSEKREVWEMVVAKARAWLEEKMGGKEEVEKLVHEAGGFV